MAKVYIAGDMLNRGAQLQRVEEREFIESQGHEFYNPMENKDINDKANAVQEGLAERIVSHDTEALLWSDTVVIEPLVHAVGTCIELGQLKGMKDIAVQILEIVGDDGSDEECFERITALCNAQVKRKVYPHYEDMRRLNLAEQSGDRREFGMHQYSYCVSLDLTDGKGMYSWDEIKEKLSV